MNRILNAFYTLYKTSRMRRSSEPAMEMVYKTLFERELARLGIEDRFYPVGYAANYSLLYVVLRAVMELPVVRVLELGCGQTTILLDGLAKVLAKKEHGGRKLEIVTLESDADWAARIGGQVKHTVTVAPLVPCEVQGAMVLGYDPLKYPKGKFDLVIVDGPVGTERLSRGGMLAMVPQILADEFMVVFDDAERPGERQTVRSFARMMAARIVGVHTIKAFKNQTIAATRGMMGGLYF